MWVYRRMKCWENESFLTSDHHSLFCMGKGWFWCGRVSSLGPAGPASEGPCAPEGTGKFQKNHGNCVLCHQNLGNSLEFTWNWFMSAGNQRIFRAPDCKRQPEYAWHVHKVFVSVYDWDPANLSYLSRAEPGKPFLLYSAYWNLKVVLWSLLLGIPPHHPSLYGWYIR